MNESNVTFMGILSVPFLLSVPGASGSASGAAGGGSSPICQDEGLDHVGTATSAYRSDKVHRWLLEHQALMRARQQP